MPPSTTPEEVVRSRWSLIDKDDSGRALFQRFRLTLALRNEAAEASVDAALLEDLENECRLFGPISHANQLPRPERHLPDLVAPDGLEYLARRITASSSPVVRGVAARLLWLAARSQFPKSGLWASEAFLEWFGAVSTKAVETGSNDLCIEALSVVEGAIDIAKHANQFDVLARLAATTMNFTTKLAAASLGRWTLECADALVSLPKKAREGLVIEPVSDLLIARAEEYRAKNSHLLRGFIEADIRLRSSFGLSPRPDYGLRAIALSFEHDAETAPSALHAGHWLRAAVEVLRKEPGSSADLSRMLTKLEAANAKGPSELKGHEFSVPVPEGALDSYFAVFDPASPADALKILTLDVNMRLDPSALREATQEQAATFVFMHLVRPTVLRPDGTSYTPADADEHQAFRLAENARMQVEVRWQMMLREHWERLRRRGLSASTIVEHLMGSNAFVEGDRPFFERFAASWIAGDRISAVHVVVPRLEHILRRLCRVLGRPTISVRENGDQQTSLESALAFLMPVDPSLFYELQLVLVDQGGYALRHTLAHGLADADDAPYSEFMVDNLLLLLIRLARLHLEQRRKE